MVSWGLPGLLQASGHGGSKLRIQRICFNMYAASSFIKRKSLGRLQENREHDTNHIIAMLTLVPSLSLSAMVSTSSTAGNALLNGRAAGSVGTPAVAFYDAGERPTWPALLARGGTGVNMAASDVAEITPDALTADPMFFDESKAIAELGFAISEEELLLKAKEYLYYGQGVARPELLASDFVFMGPFVGGAGGLALHAERKRPFASATACDTASWGWHGGLWAALRTLEDRPPLTAQ